MSLERATPALTPEEQAALAIFKGHRALVKVIFDYVCGEEDKEGRCKKYVIDYSDIDFTLHQLLDPNEYRPSRSAYYYASAGKTRPDVVIKTNLKTGEKHEHHTGCRDKHHQGVVYTHTLKTSTTLLPTEPQYGQVIGGNEIGHIIFGWDIDACDLKDGKYVWETDGGTNCQWLSPKPFDDGEDTPPVSTVDAIRANNDKAVAAKKPIYNGPCGWPELLARLPKRIIHFMGCTLDTREARLRAWDAMLHTKQVLNLEKDIPVFVIQFFSVYDEKIVGVFRVYTKAEREKDLQAFHLENGVHYFNKAAAMPAPRMTQEKFDATYRKIIQADLARAALKRQTKIIDELRALPPVDANDALIRQMTNIINQDSSARYKSITLAKLLALHYLHHMMFYHMQGTTEFKLFDKISPATVMFIKALRTMMKTQFGIDLPAKIEDCQRGSSFAMPLSDSFCKKTGCSEKEFLFDYDIIKNIHCFAGSEFIAKNARRLKQ